MVLAQEVVLGYTAGEILIALVATVIIVMAASWLFGHFK